VTSRCRSACYIYCPLCLLAASLALAASSYYAYVLSQVVLRHISLCFSLSLSLSDMSPCPLHTCRHARYAHCPTHLPTPLTPNPTHSATYTHLHTLQPRGNHAAHTRHTDAHTPSPARTWKCRRKIEAKAFFGQRKHRERQRKHRERQLSLLPALPSPRAPSLSHTLSLAHFVCAIASRLLSVSISHSISLSPSVCLSLTFHQPLAFCLSRILYLCHTLLAFYRWRHV